MVDVNYLPDCILNLNRYQDELREWAGKIDWPTTDWSARESCLT
jgi:hypothetical protein